MAPLGIGLAQGAQVALGQLLHQLFQLVRLQAVPQQRDALALFTVLRGVHAQADQDQRHINVHAAIVRPFCGPPGAGVSAVDIYTKQMLAINRAACYGSKP